MLKTHLGISRTRSGLSLLATTAISLAAIIASVFSHPALAAPVEGEPCDVSAGYVGHWRKSTVSGITTMICVFDRSQTSSPSTTYCPNGQTNCNAFVFGYADPGSKRRFCVPTSGDKTAACRQLSAERQQKRGEQPSVFEDLKAFVTGKKAITYNELNSHLKNNQRDINRLLANHALVNKTEKEIAAKAPKESVSAAKSAADKMAAAAKTYSKPLKNAEAQDRQGKAKAKAITQEAQAKTRQEVAAAKELSAAERVAANLKAREQKDGLEDAMAAHAEAQVAPNTASAAPQPLPPESALLGPELSCVRDGLLKSFPQDAPSERYLALLATAAQHYNGPFNPDDPAHVTDLRRRVIQMVQAYGYCSEKSYPTAELANLKLDKQVRDWLTAAGGSIRTNGGNYIEAAAGDAKGKVGTTRIADAFGIDDGGWHLFSDRPVFDYLFKVEDKQWDAMTAAERQSNWAHSARNINDRPSWKSCREDLQNRMAKEPAFRLQLTPGGTGYLDERDFKNEKGEWNAPNPPITKLTEAKENSDYVSRMSVNVCKAMTESCKLPDTVCADGPGLGASQDTLSPGSGSWVTPRGVRYQDSNKTKSGQAIQ